MELFERQSVRQPRGLYTKDNTMGGTRVNDKNILVCVTQQKNCEHLITLASKIERGNGSIYVLHVLGNNGKFLNNNQENRALEYLFSVSKSVGAPMTVLRSDDTIGAIANFINTNSIHTAVLGESPVIKNHEAFSTILQRAVGTCEVLTL